VLQQYVRKIEPGEGEKFDIAGAHLTWKVKVPTRNPVRLTGSNRVRAKKIWFMTEISG